MTIQEFAVIGVLTAIGVMWAQVQHVLSWPIRWMMVRRRVDRDAGGAILTYLKATGRSRPRDGGYYAADRMHVRPIGRSILVFYELLCSGPQLVWMRMVPIWFLATETAVNGGPQTTHLTFYFLRGTVAWDSLCRRAAEWDDEHTQSRGGSRFRVRYHGGQMEQWKDAPTSAPSPVGTGAAGDRRLLHWQPDDIGYARPAGLDVMSLRPEMESLRRDVARFIASREWYEERGIPWRRGWKLHGPPGTGKTSFVRGIAVDQDLPVHAFDLGSMDNYSLRTAWDSMLRDTPCIALIEDIDGVYGVEREDGTWDGRARRAGGPTFDAILQCVGGVATCDGVLLFVTTNHADRIDPALSRGGRIDMSVEFLAPDEDGRRKIARRILGSGADVDAVLRDLPDASAADLQERISEIALAQRDKSEAA